MKRRDVELFNISFLDILSGALGAVLFLFIVVPKGEGRGPAAHPQLSVVLDTVQNKFFGELPDSLRASDAGDTLLSIVFDYKRMPSIENCPEPKPCPELPDMRAMHRYIAKLEAELSRFKIDNKKMKSKEKSLRNLVDKSKQKRKEKKHIEKLVKRQTNDNYKGDMPNVPCKFSVEIKWTDIVDNVDLFLCKDGKCVYGGKRKRKQIGFWDSGKSKTSIFGGDLRTTQEAIRQFDSVIEGDYKIYAQYKSAKEAPKASVVIQGLVYTNTDENGPKSKTFTHELNFNKKERTFIGSLKLKSDGSFTFNHSN